MAEKTLAAKLAEIYVEAERFKKSKKVTGSGPTFSYTPIEEIADYLRDALGKRGIIMVPSRSEVVVTEDAGTTKAGATRWRHIVRMGWTLTDGTTSIEVESVGEAMDTSDKGMNKAQTAARKYALIGAFQLSTGDDADARHPEQADYRRPAPAEVDDQGVRLISEGQRRRIFATGKGLDKDRIKAIILDLTGQDSTKGIPLAKYDAVVSAVEHYAKATLEAAIGNGGDPDNPSEDERRAERRAELAAALPGQATIGDAA